MSEALKRARHEVAGRLEAAKDDFDAMNRRTAAQSNRDGERRAEWAARIEEDQATLDAIDAAIAAETTAKVGLSDVSINLGDDQVVTLKVSVADAKKLTETRFQRRASFAGWSEPELKSAVDALEDALSKAEAPTKKPEPLRIPIEFETSGLKEVLEGLLTYLKSAKPGFATGGIAGADVEPGFVGELPAGSFWEPAQTVRLEDEVDRGWTMLGDQQGDRPIQLGDTVEARTKFRVIGISERSTDGLRLGVSQEDGPFCQLEVQACGTIKTLELLASDLRRP